MTDEDINNIFMRIGTEYGCKNTTASFVESCDLKVKWMRCGSSVNFWVTDYLKDAPKEALESLASTIFRRMYEDSDLTYDEGFTDYVSTDSFVEANQPTYLSRLGKASASPVGRFKDLRESVHRISDEGLATIPSHTYVGWMSMGPSDRIGHSSALMRSILISDRLDSQDMPDDILDFCVYTQMLKVQQGFKTVYDRDDRAYCSKIDAYPDSHRIITELGRRGMSLWNTLSPGC